MTNEQPSTIPLPHAMINKPTAPQVPTNPLAQFFRHAGTITTLPTKGKFWPEGTLEMTPQGELEIYPMTARDEIMMKSPDGLLNGTSIIGMIASCVPGIKDPGKMPGIDLDTILIAIRLATYGPDLEIITVCDHCEKQNENTVDLRVLLDNIPSGPINNVVQVGELTLTLQPYDYNFMNEVNLNSFEEKQLLRSVNGNTMTSEEKSEYFENTFKKLVKHTIDSIAIAVIKITLPDGSEVIDKNMIEQFFQNCDRAVFNETKDNIIALSEFTQYPPVTIKCEHCNKTYETNIQFDQTNFFE